MNTILEYLVSFEGFIIDRNVQIECLFNAVKMYQFVFKINFFWFLTRNLKFQTSKEIELISVKK